MRNCFESFMILTNILVIPIVIWAEGLDNQKNLLEAVEKTSPLAKIEKVDAVQICNKEGCNVYGRILFGIQPDKFFALDLKETSELIKVVIYREITAENEERAKELNVRVGVAYLLTQNGEYKYIRDVDLSLTNKELAEQFGVSISKESNTEKIRYFLSLIEHKIDLKWKRPIEGRIRETVVQFNISLNGSVEQVHTKVSSGDQSFDQSTLSAISQASPFPPLPRMWKDRNYSGDTLSVNCNFIADIGVNCFTD